MRRHAILPLLVLLVTFPALAEEDGLDVEIWVLRMIRDTDLETAAKETAMLGGYEIEVEPALRQKKITLDLDAPIEQALADIAKAAGAHLWKLDGKRFAIRAKPQGATDEKPAEEKPEPAPPPPPEPWEKDVDAALERAKLKVSLAGNEPLPDLLAGFSKKCKVPIDLDPGSANARSDSPLRMVVTSDEPVTVKRALSMLFLSRGVAWDIRFGGVLVATVDRLDEVPKRLFPPAAEDATEEEQRLRKKLASRKLTLKLDGVTLEKALTTMARRGGFKIRIDDGVENRRREQKVTLHLARRRLDHALSVLLLPRGLGVTIEGSGLRVVPAKAGR